LIKNFKIFEKLNIGKPKVGDYAIIEFNLQKINTIVKIDHISKMGSPFNYMVKFIDENFYFYDYGFSDDVQAVRRDEILYWSKNKKDLELQLQANKYNL